MNEIFDFINGCSDYYLATMDGDQPRVRPFGTVDLYNGKLYIQTGKVKDVFKQLTINPKAELCAFKDGQWVRVSGVLKADDSFEAKKHMLDKYPQLRGRYSENDGNTIVLYFESGEAAFSSFTVPSRTIKF